MVNLSVSLNESFNSSFIDNVKHISRKETQSSSVDQKGYLSKTFSFELTSLRFDSQNILESAIKSLVDEVIADNTDFGDPVSIEKGIKRDGNSASLTISFSTDPNQRQGDLVTYSVQESKVGQFREYSLSANYKAKGKTDREKFNNAKELWISKKGDNITKVQSVFAGLPTIYEKNRNANFQKTEGIITENIVFTTDPAYDYQEDGLLKFKVTVSNTKKVKRNEVVFDLADLNDKLVINDLQSVGSAKVTANATIDPKRDLYGGKEALLARTSDIEAFVTGSKIFTTSDVVNLDLAQGTSSRTISYLYI